MKQMKIRKESKKKKSIYGSDYYESNIEVILLIIVYNYNYEYVSEAKYLIELWVNANEEMNDINSNLTLTFKFIKYLIENGEDVNKNGI